MPEKRAREGKPAFRQMEWKIEGRIENTL